MRGPGMPGPPRMSAHSSLRSQNPKEDAMLTTFPVCHDLAFLCVSVVN
jgi:hypothetical protein